MFRKPFTKKDLRLALGWLFVALLGCAVWVPAANVVWQLANAVDLRVRPVRGNSFAHLILMVQNLDYTAALPAALICLFCAVGACLERNGKAIPRLWVLAVIMVVALSAAFICIWYLLKPFGAPGWYTIP